jgi:superfamily II DNA or RNA helicase
MRITLHPSRLEDYRLFLRIKQLPAYRIQGCTAIVPDEYAALLDQPSRNGKRITYNPSSFLFDYQADITRMALDKGRFSIFADCGLGKTLIAAEYIRHIVPTLRPNQCVLIVSPLMVIPQTIRELHRFYGDDFPIEQIAACDLSTWLRSGKTQVGITNYNGLRDDTPQGRLACLVLDESSMLKSHYGKWGQVCLRLGCGLRWKLAMTGTPAPNDRIEYANHAVFCDASRTVNEFLARYFVNRGQTTERWVLKAHALRPFYRALSHWCIFLTNPGVYGWHDNTEPLPPINVHMHHVPLTEAQRDLVYREHGQLFATNVGGITSRSVLSQIAKGTHRGKPIATNKPSFIRKLVESWPGESTIVWCIYNAEQATLERELPNAASIKGDTPHDARQRLVEAFKAGEIKTLISKPKILGFGLNLHRATRQVFSGLQDSYESYYQAVKRSNRYGATHPLNVHIPMTSLERPMIETVLVKAKRVQEDTEQQERIFRDASTIRD